MEKDRAPAPLTLEEFNVWSSKAPVNRPGPQRTAKRLSARLYYQLTPLERGSVSVALFHADIGEGRDEFDRLAEKIRERLFPAKETK